MIGEGLPVGEVPERTEELQPPGLISCYELVQDDLQPVAAVRVVVETRSAPSLPYVTRKNAMPDLQARLNAALHNATPTFYLAVVRKDLLIDGFAPLSLLDYAVMTELESEAAALGYPELA